MVVLEQKELQTLFKSKGDVTLHETAEEAFLALSTLYHRSCSLIEKAFKGFVEGDLSLIQPREATYPFVGFIISEGEEVVDPSFSFGVIDSPGVYSGTFTQTDLFASYLKEQMELLLSHYPGLKLYVGLSANPIPMPFVIDRTCHPLTPLQLQALKNNFVHPDLTRIDDHIVNHTYSPVLGQPAPLALFTAERVDFSLHRLSHYTGTSPKHFQNFILLTNYQRYMGEFQRYAVEKLEEGTEFISFVGPGDVEIASGNLHEGMEAFRALQHLSQMPAYHLKRHDGNGITFINIGIGPSNAKTITDHLAVLRPHCWLMLGHCAGFRHNQRLGDYVLAHGYVREDHVLDQDLPLWAPVPPIAEIQIALQRSVSEVTGLTGPALKSRLRTGTVFTTDNRNWELRSVELYERFNQSRAIALDMESATIAANGLRFRVPYGTLLCVSDKPIHGEIKLKGTANAFYEERVAQHLKIGLRTIDLIRQAGIDTLHSRKLRGFDEPAFR